MSAIYRFGDFTLAADTRELKRGAAAVALSPRAFDCLAYLVAHRDRAVGKDELVAAIWQRVDVSDTQLGQTVLRARRAVDDDGQTQTVIRTVSRFGYRWVAEVSTREDATNDALARVDSLADDTTTQLDGDATRATSRGDSNRSEPADSDSDRRADTDTDADADAETVADEDVSMSAPSPRIAESPRAASRRRPFARAAVAALVIVGIGAAFAYRAWHLRSNAPREAAVATAVVLPLRVEAGDDAAWLRLGAMDLVASRLRAGGLGVPPSETTVALLRGDAALDPVATARTVRQATPDALVVDGRVAEAHDAWTIALHAVAADGTTLDVEASAADALDAARNASDRLLGRLGHASVAPTERASAAAERLARAEAALLANDLDGARAIIVGDPDLARAEPELGLRLAEVDFRAGQYANAETSLTSLLADAPKDDRRFRARVLDGRGAVRIRQDDPDGAARDYEDALALLDGLGDPAESGRALTGRGVAHMMRREFAPALADFGQARVRLAEAGNVLAIARVDADQGGLEMNRDRPEAALPYLDAAAATFERYGAINELMAALESLVSNAIVLLRPADALAASDRSWALATRVTDPNQHANLVEDRADVFLVLGRLGEAAALLSTLPAEAAGSDPFVARRLHALRARVALARGDHATALDEAARALAMRAPSDDLGEGVAEIALVYQRAKLAGSSHDDLSRAPASAWIDFDAPARYPAQAIAEAEWSAFRGDDDAAAGAFAHALSIAEARGEPIDVVSVSASYGPWLLAQGRIGEAGDVIGRVAPWASRDYDAALLQARLFHALGEPAAWAGALAQARSLAGERELPPAIVKSPMRDRAVVASRAR